MAKIEATFYQTEMLADLQAIIKHSHYQGQLLTKYRWPSPTEATQYLTKHFTEAMVNNQPFDEDRLMPMVIANLDKVRKVYDNDHQLMTLLATHQWGEIDRTVRQHLLPEIIHMLINMQVLKMDYAQMPIDI